VRPLARAAALALALPVAAGAGSALAATVGKRAPKHTAVGVAQREFRITPYRRVVPPGPVKFNVRNFGEDTHNLVVTGPRGFFVQGPDVGSGDRMTVEATLARPGTYSLICTRADHARLGMVTKIKVRRPASRKRR
jgi:plastocyanin